MTDPRNVSMGSTWEAAAVAVLAAQAAARVEPEAAAKAAAAYADALMVAIVHQDMEESKAARDRANAELEEVRARFPLGSMASCVGWGPAPVVKVERGGSLHHRDEITVSIFHEGRRGGSGLTLPHTHFTPYLSSCEDEREEDEREG